MVSARSTFCSQCGAAAEQRAAEDDELTDQVRSLFAGEIAVDREIGRGSMAVVYVGLDLALERRVAIKVLLPDVAGDADIADRFKREAKLIAALNHPNVIPIYGLRNSAALSAILMQYIDGNSLDVVLRERASSTLPLSVASLILSQAATGLEHAHTRGVVHRDVKPANVLLDPAGHVVVSDFGIARRFGGVSATESGVLIGTASYMSPEQCLGRRADAKSDQYAFGVMAFEVLAGRRPFLGRTSDVLSAHINKPPPRLSAFRPDLSPEIESFVMRMLEKDPAMRHSNLHDAARFFGRLVADRSSATSQLMHASLRKPIVPARPSHVVVESSRTAATPENRSAQGGSRALGLLVGGVGLALVVGAGALVLRSARSRSEKPVPSVSEVSQRVASRQPTSPAESSTKQTIRIPDQPAARSITASQPQQETAHVPTTGAQPAIKPAIDSVVRTDTASAGLRPQGEVQPTLVTPPPSPSATATAADARAVASEFLTWCNHRQWRDVERLPSLEGSTELRTSLIGLIRSAPDFQAGFERLASRPMVTDRTFTTDFVLDLEWRGGQRQLQVTVSAELSNGSWHLAGFGVHPPD
jgi:serine/threonine-protein kinase